MTSSQHSETSTAPCLYSTVTAMEAQSCRRASCWSRASPSTCSNFAGAVRVPPIALLSACDTHALDGSHATPANAFMNAGADTVVATSFPVNAK